MLGPGSSLSHYKLIEQIGEGGMGVVWRAHDTSLGRDVAIKVLPEALAGDAERLARFEREARLLASLNHPHIASIYGLDSDQGVRFLAMEVVEGEDLSERLRSGPLPVDEALRLALQIAEALENAHENGVIHRDLKPANIKLGAPDSGSSASAGGVKVLDFGLAKALEGEPQAASGSGPRLSQSPTITAAMTAANVILGTAAYMSPEQARGQAADKRGDIWSFGVVLFEMLTGRQLFSGETVSDTLASVLKIEVDFSALPKELPGRAMTLLQRCLDRDRRTRLRDIGEARIALNDLLSGAPDRHVSNVREAGELAEAGVAKATGGASTLRNALFGVAGLILGSVLVFLLNRPIDPGVDGGGMPLRRFELGATKEAGVTPRVPAMSPDGERIAYHMGRSIHVREMNKLEVKEFAYDKNVFDLFWSPDGAHLGIVSSAAVDRIDVNGDQVSTVCSAPPTSGGAGGYWRDDGVIVFSVGDEGGLMQVNSIGGDATTLAPADTSIETDVHDPFVLPDNRGVLVVPHLKEGLFQSIHLITDDGRKELVVMPEQALSDPCYAPSGHILFHRQPTNPGVWAVPFSLEKLEVTGEPFLVVENAARPTVASDGTLTYTKGIGSLSLRLTVNDLTGTEIVDLGEVGRTVGFMFPAFSPRGDRAIVNIDDVDNSELWVFDVDRRTRARLSFEPGREQLPAWTPDGLHVVYHKNLARKDGIQGNELMMRAADGTGAVDSLGFGSAPTWSPDGQNLLFGLFETINKADLYYARSEDGFKPRLLVSGPGVQFDGRVSPQGRHVAYASSQSGDFEIYVTRFPEGTGRWQVSVGGGMHPRWNRSGTQLYFTRGDAIMVADVQMGTSPVVGTPREVLRREPLLISTIADWDAGFDVAQVDGNDRFVYYRNPGTTEGGNDIVVVQNWFEDFRNR